MAANDAPTPDAGMALTSDARAALLRSENDWSFVYNLHPDVALAPEIRRAIAAENLRLIRLALGDDAGGFVPDGFEI